MIEQFFISLKEYGRVDENGKLIVGFGTRAKRLIAKPDRPLMLIASLIDQLLLPSMTYSDDVAAKADIENFKQFAAGLGAE